MEKGSEVIKTQPSVPTLFTSPPPPRSLLSDYTGLSDLCGERSGRIVQVSPHPRTDCSCTYVQVTRV